MRTPGSNHSLRQQRSQGTMHWSQGVTTAVHSATTKPKSYDPCARGVTSWNTNRMQLYYLIHRKKIIGVFSVSASFKSRSEIPMASQEQSLKLPTCYNPPFLPFCFTPYIFHIILSWQILLRLLQLNSYSSSWFMTIRCFLIRAHVGSF